jgi:DNA-binding PadR family transcriptional regulator
MGRLSRLIEPVVLLMIRNQPGIYGYDILAEADKLAMTDSEVDAGAVYRTLHTLEENGMVTSALDASKVGPTRRCYTLTQSGIEHLREWCELIDKRRREMEHFLEVYKDNS